MVGSFFKCLNVLLFLLPNPLHQMLWMYQAITIQFAGTFAFGNCKPHQKCYFARQRPYVCYPKARGHWHEYLLFLSEAK